MYQDEERIILGAWLKLEHTKDIDIVSAGDFMVYPRIAKSIIDIIKTAERKDEHLSEDTLLIETQKRSEAGFIELVSMQSAYMELSRTNSYELAIRRIISVKAKQYISSVPADATMEEIRTELKKLDVSERHGLPQATSDFMMTITNELDDRYNRKIVNTGLADLDYLLCGIRKGELTTVGARPSVGKSAFTLQLALNVARQGEKVLYFPLEMSAMQTFERIIMRNTDKDVSHNAMSNGRLTHEDWKEITKGLTVLDELDKMGTFKIFECVNSLSVIRKLIDYHKPYMVVIDQLEQLTDDVRFRDKRERFSYMTNNLKRISMDSDIAVILAAQLNRDGKTEPSLIHLKESGSIEEDSDNVILLHRKEEDEMDYPEEWSNIYRPVLIKLEKHRNGMTGEFMTAFRANKFKFTCLERY